MTAKDLKLDGYASSAGRIWATRADNDKVGWAGLGTRFLVDGVDPITNIFDARVLASDPGTTDGFAAHSQYWSDRNLALANIAKITTGAGDCGFIDTDTIPQDRDPSVGNTVTGCEVTWW